MPIPAAGTATAMTVSVPATTAMLPISWKPDSVMDLPTMSQLPSTFSSTSPTGRLSTSSTGRSTAARRSSRTRRLSAICQALRAARYPAPMRVAPPNRATAR